MSVISRIASRVAHDDQGFTLIEVLVATVTSIVVVFALFTILEISLHQTSQITDSVQAEQLGRSALTKVVDELHSACIAREFAPVQEKSSASELRFRTAYGESAAVEGAHAAEHHIVWTGKAPGPGKLIDYTFRSSGGTAPNFIYEATETPKGGTLLGENIYEAEVVSGGKKVPVPIFQYEKYNTKSIGTAETPLGTLLAVTPPEKGFTSGEAATVAAVLVTFTSAPTNNNLTLFRAAEFSNLVTFAFAAPASEATIADGPCR